jgi:Zn-dependent protease
MTGEQIALAITYYVVLLFSLSVHESAHALAALRMGDPTGVDLGRASLNPLVHVDFVGTVVMPALQVAMSGVPLLAWAKPTPYDPSRFAPGQQARGHVAVAGAGPLSNLGLALLFTLLLFVAVHAGLASSRRSVPFLILAIGVQMNVALALFNLVPLPPLDGSKVASWGLPRSLADSYDKLVAGFGTWLLLLALVPLGYVLGPLTDYFSGLLYSLVL